MFVRKKMLIYNVTVNIEDEIEETWLKWMREVHIPQVLDTGFFVKSRIFKILYNPVDETGKSYCIQYQCKSMEDYETYHNEYAPALQKVHASKFAGQFTAVRTLMNEV
jgi:hypothetical protein